MLAELPPPSHEQARPLRDDEKALLKALLPNSQDFQLLEREIARSTVIDMPDGGMGSVRFTAPDEQSFGETLIEAECRDTDGVLVSIAVNLDSRGRLYEIDFWRTDFSKLKKYPLPDSIKIKTRR